MTDSETTAGGGRRAGSQAREGGSPQWLELLKVVAMPLVALIVGFVVNSSLDSRQERENNVRVYAEMMGRREEADSGLRKDMFQSILQTFLRQDPGLTREQHLDQQILNLELLAYNFHESLDLAPLFKHVRGQILEGKEKNPNTEGSPSALRSRRLEKVALEVNERELTVLADSGAVVRGGVELSKVKDVALSPTFPDEYRATKTASSPMKAGAADPPPRLCLQMKAGNGERHYRQFRMEVIDHDPLAREVQVRLYTSRPLNLSDCERADLELVHHREIDTNFWVGLFDFPMIDNTRLTHSERCAVTMTMLTADAAYLALAYFPGSRASLKDKPYYDELLHDLLRAPEWSGRGKH